MRPRILPGYPALLLPAALLAALLIFISKVSIVREYGNNTPFWDQWDAEAEQLYKPYKQGRLGLSSILRTHNEHRITTTRTLHLGLFVLTGCKWTPKLQMYVNALLHVSAISLFLAFTCWAVPTRARLPVWIAGTLLFLVPFGWDNVLQGFNTHFYTLLFFSVALLWTCCIARSLLPSAAIAILLAISCVLTMASGALVLVAACVILGFRVLLFGETRVPAVLVFVFSVIAATSVIYTPRLEHHEHLRSASMGQFFGAMVQAYA